MLDVRKNRFRALEVAFAAFRHADVTRRAVEQADPELSFKKCDGARYLGGRAIHLPGGGGKAARLHDAYEYANCSEKIHLHVTLEGKRARYR
ncbi:hypothetical protein BvRS1_22100 [Burkholderia vietnamiensis]|nr:hypothetical protein BvRS1_22100 [Burkholderia vietnamiensis]